MYWSNDHLIATYEENEETIGPEAEIEYESGEFKSGSIKGYMSTFGFDGKNELLISLDQGNSFKYTTSFQGNIYNEIPAKMDLEAVYDGSDPGAIDFKVG